MGGSLSPKSRDVPGPCKFRNVPALLAAAALLAAVAASARAADLFLVEEPEVYAAVDRLNASGVLPGFLANTRPYSVAAVREATRSAIAKAASRTPTAAPLDPFDREVLAWLAEYTATPETARVTVGGAWSEARYTPPNDDGVPVPAEWSGQASFSARDEVTPYVSGHLRALSFYGEGGDDGNRLLEAALETGYRSASLQVGKLSSWYGPGRRGALIFTNNAAPYPGVRLHNPEPIPLSGWLSFLGNFQYDLFFARMGKKPLRSHSRLVGVRLAARPAGWLELGVSRALHYGGDGASNGFSEFWTDFWGNNEPSDRSNSLVGFDLTLTLPIGPQPVQLYWSPAGEHSRPKEWANQVGVYFPRIPGIPRLDLRAEYADTFGAQAKRIEWYGSANYPHRYHGDLLGHALGPYSRELSFVSRYFLRPSSFAELSYDRILHDGGALDGERHDVFGAGVSGWLTPRWRAEARAAADRLTRRAGVSGAERTDFSAFLAVAYQVPSLTNP
ncbi:MAG: capsule assembly Wzi family protein [Gemmatimonadota bacterium]